MDLDIQKKEPNDTNQSSLTLLRDSYKSGLYLFGFIKIIKGKRLEKVFWTASMLLILAFTSYMVYRNAVRYAAFGVNTKIWEENAPQRKLPVITFCLESSFDNKLKSKMSPQRIQMSYILGGEEIKGKYLGNDCYVVNENQTIELSVDGEYQKVGVIDYSKNNERMFNKLHIILQSSEEFRNNKEHIYLTQYFKNLRLKHGVYDVYIQEKRINSLPAPYTSNCTDGNLVSNIFSAKYTYDSCLETCAYNYMYQKCNDTIDMWKKYRAPINKTVQNPFLEDCFEETIDEIELRRFPDCKCARACKEIVYTATPTRRKDTSVRWEFFFYLKDAATRVDLVPDYPFEAFMGSLGGVLGLGGKIMATLQLMIFLSLCIANLRIR